VLLAKDGKPTLPTVGRVVRPQGGGSQIEYGSSHQISLSNHKDIGNISKANN